MGASNDAERPKASEEGSGRTQNGNARGTDPRPKPLSFSVRFESHDDFLVEYTDHLRHGVVSLPLPEPIRPGQPVRLKLHLPDDALLYLTGTATSTDERVGDERTKVKLDGLTPAQKRAVDRCVDRLVGKTKTGEFPRADGDAQPIVDEAMTVLLVDDSVSHRIEIGDALRARGLRVRTAENGLLALSSALKRPPDIVLTDVEMPQMDGWTLLRSVRQRKRLLHIPVVFLTRLSDELSRLRGYRLGVDDFLQKTLDPTEIVARLHGVLARRRQLPASTDAHGLRGELEHVRLGSLLSFIESERRSGALILRNGSDNATMHIRDGHLERVENLGRFRHPHDRVFELLSWAFGEFEFLSQSEAGPPAANDPETTPLSYLLMEHARRADEAAK